MPEERPQCLKAVWIAASGRGIDFVKQKGRCVIVLFGNYVMVGFISCWINGLGFKRLKICMESDYMILNVANWCKKFVRDPEDISEVRKCSDWDEFKYMPEILQLCEAFQGMVVKWVGHNRKLDII
jgi:hypothetical protein